MYYEFYLDVYFLENLAMNYLILRMTGEAADRKGKKGRLLAASVLGAAASCLMAAGMSSGNPAVLWLVNVLTGYVMACAAYWERKAPLRMAFWLTFLVQICVLGGVWRILQRMMAGAFWLIVPAGYAGVFLVHKLWRRGRQRTRYLYQAQLYFQGRSVTVTALFDSGNGLEQPGSKKPVQIASYAAVKELLGEAMANELEAFLQMTPPKEASGRITYLPYHSIGVAQGLLPAFTADELCVFCEGQEKRTKEALIAVSKAEVSSRGEYQMILHPRIIE